MSYPKMDRLFPLENSRLTEVELALRIATALRDDFDDFSSSIKHIGQQTGANLRAIKNWIDARNAPSSIHLLALARISPSTLRIVLEQVGGSDLFDAFELLSPRPKSKKMTSKNIIPLTIYSAENCTINVSIAREVASKTNQRQLWFLGHLQQRRQLKARDIVVYWRVSTRTAKTDLARMIQMGLIRFVGAKKTGWYESLIPEGFIEGAIKAQKTID